MSGADRYTEAIHTLAQAHKHHDDHSERIARLLEAQVYATLAQAAATALTVTYSVVGDSEEVTDWARLIQTGAMATTKRKAEPDPAFWPPQPGDIWTDRDSNNWMCLADRTLACAAHRADDTADEIRHLYGEMRLVYRGGAACEECPF